MQMEATDTSTLLAEVSQLRPHAVRSMQLPVTGSAAVSEHLAKAVRTSLTCEGADVSFGLCSATSIVASKLARFGRFVRRRHMRHRRMSAHSPNPAGLLALHLGRASPIHPFSRWTFPFSLTPSACCIPAPAMLYFPYTPHERRASYELPLPYQRALPHP